MVTLHHSASQPLHHQHPKRRSVALRSTCKQAMLLQVYEQRWLGEMLGWQSAGRPIQTSTHHPLRIFEKEEEEESRKH